MVQHIPGTVPHPHRMDTPTHPRRPLGGLYARFDEATQTAAEAFAGLYGANVTVALTIPGRRASSQWEIPEPPPSIEDALNAYADAMAEAYGLERSAVEIHISFAPDKTFSGATLSFSGQKGWFPTITVQAWRDPETETYVARAKSPPLRPNSLPPLPDFGSVPPIPKKRGRPPKP